MYQHYITSYFTEITVFFYRAQYFTIYNPATPASRQCLPRQMSQFKYVIVFHLFFIQPSWFSI